MKTAILMTVNSCRDRANFAKQTFTEGPTLYAKNNKPPVSYGHMPTLPPR